MEVVLKHARIFRNAPVDGFNGIDRLSNLPNGILCRILLFLPTKYGVGTSVLSARWKNLLPLIPNLRIDLSDTALLHPGSASDLTVINFKSFVDRLLNMTLHDVTSASCFYLYCEEFNEGQDIAKWIDAALRLNVKLMDLYILKLVNSDCILESFSGANITHLNLMLGCVDSSTEYKFYLPNLKGLSVLYFGSIAVSVLLEGCHVLEHVELYNCHANPEEVLSVRNPFLRVLKFYNGIDYFDGDLEISTLKLEYLMYDGFHPNHYIALKL